MALITLRRHFDSLAAPGPTSARERRSGSAAAPSPRRRVGLLSVASLRRVSFGVRADTPSTRQTARAPMPYPLSHVRVLTRDEFAAVHGDGGKDGSYGLTVAPLAAPNNGARGNP